MLLSTLETTIVSTSLVAMANDLQGFGQAGWVVTAYFLTYTGAFTCLIPLETEPHAPNHIAYAGFLVIYAKLSDIFGTKLLLLFAVTIFAVFSVACGVSGTMMQLFVHPHRPLLFTSINYLQVSNNTNTASSSAHFKA